MSKEKDFKHEINDEYKHHSGGMFIPTPTFVVNESEEDFINDVNDDSEERKDD